MQLQQSHVARRRTEGRVACERLRKAASWSAMENRILLPATPGRRFRRCRRTGGVPQPLETARESLVIGQVCTAGHGPHNSGEKGPTNLGTYNLETNTEQMVAWQETVFVTADAPVSKPAAPPPSQVADVASL